MFYLLIKARIKYIYAFRIYEVPFRIMTDSLPVQTESKYKSPTLFIQNKGKFPI